MEGRYRPWKDKAIVGGGSAVGGGVEAVMLFSTVEGGGSSGEKGQPGEGRHSGGGVKARIGREAAEVCSGSRAICHDCSRGGLFGGGLLGEGIHTEAG